MRRRAVLAYTAAFALALAACGQAEDEPADTTEAPPAATTTEAPPAGEAANEIGGETNPIQVLFVPSVSAEEIIAGGEVLKEALEAETGLFFDVAVGSSYAAVLEEMCASPTKVMGFIPAQAYILGSDLCGIDVAMKSIRFGYDVYWTQFIVPRDSDIETLDDLAGKTWAYPETTSTSGFLVPSGVFASLGIEPSDSFEAGGHSATAQAVYDGSADFGTTFFSPAVDAERNVVWDGDPDNADVPDDIVEACALDADGEILCGDDFYPRDARRNIREDAPDVIQEVRIVTLSEEIPNDTLSYSPEFPEEVRNTVNNALKTLAENDPDAFEAAFAAYSWSGVADTSDEEFDYIRALLVNLGFTIDEL